MAGKDSDGLIDGEALKAWRQRMGWTQARAAEELGLHLHSLKNLEAGKRAVGGSLARLLDTLELRGRRSTKPTRSQAAASPPAEPAAATGTWVSAADAELIEVGRRFAKVGAAHITALLRGEVTPELQAEMKAAEADVKRMQALEDRPFSEWAMSVCGAFIQITSAGERAALAALGAGGSRTRVARAADMRNGTLSDVAPTLTAGGQGVSLNSVPSVLVVEKLIATAVEEAQTLMAKLGAPAADEKRKKRTKPK